MNHEVKKLKNENYRVIYHCHATNVIALTFILPLKDEIFTRELWEMATECPVVFPDGVGVVPWMVPGGRDIAIATSELMKNMTWQSGLIMVSFVQEATLILLSVLLIQLKNQLQF